MHSINCLSSAIALALLTANFALGADAPVYSNGLLTIPSVNTASQVGQYQDVSFKFTEGLWQLLSVRTIGASGLGLAPINRVDVISTGIFPTQVFLRVSGAFGDGCPKVGQINQRLENNRFDITVTQFITYPPVGPCTAAIVPFAKTIPLPVYALRAGTYTYNVNGITGAFPLAADNLLPGDTALKN